VKIGQPPRLASAALGLALGLSAALAPAAVLMLHDGKKVDGDVTEKGDAYEVKTRYGTLTVQKSDVRRIVQGPAQAVAEADNCRKVARGMYDDALKCETVPERNRKLTVGLEMLQKALMIYNDAREIFAGPEHNALDKTATEIVQEMRVYRDRMGAEPSAPPPAPQPEKPAPPGAGTPAPESPSLPASLPPPVPTTPEKLLTDAKRAAAAKRHTDARYLIARILQQYPGTSAAREAQALLDAIPHPDGRLVCGFDEPADLRAWRVVNPYKKNLIFEPTTDPKEVQEGKGAARLSLPRDPDYTTGALVTELDRFDASRVKTISLWLYQARPSPGRLEIAFIRANQDALPWIDRWGGSELGACLYRAIPLDFTGWKKITIAMSEFQPRGASGSNGKIGWRDAGALVIYDASRKGVDVLIDGLRFLETEKR
jgi:hypothetical protein